MGISHSRFKRLNGSKASSSSPTSFDTSHGEKANLCRNVANSSKAPSKDDMATSYATFLKAYPEYALTWILDDLRRSDYARLDQIDETYVDYMGGALYPESLVRSHADFLTRNLLGNTHSVSNRYVVDH